VAGIKAAHAEGRVKVVTFNGTPSVLKMVQDRNVVEIDSGMANAGERGRCFIDTTCGSIRRQKLPS